MLDGHGNKIDPQKERQQAALRRLLRNGYAQQQAAAVAMQPWAELERLFGLEQKRGE